MGSIVSMAVYLGPDSECAFDKANNMPLHKKGRDMKSVPSA
jgi:hypothetical protein